MQNIDQYLVHAEPLLNPADIIPMLYSASLRDTHKVGFLGWAFLDVLFPNIDYNTLIYGACDYISSMHLPKAVPYQ